MCPFSIRVSPTSPLETGEAKLWVLLVGVNNYQDKDLPSLLYSVSDCQGLAEALTQATEGFPRKLIITHHDDSEKLPLTKNVLASLEEIVNKAEPKDTVLLYFSGHGMLESNSKQTVLCLADTQTSDLLDTGLELQKVLDLLPNSSAGQQLVWLDACHSGGMKILGTRSETKLEPPPNSTDQMKEVLRQRAQKSKGFYALLSCDQGERSWEFPQLGHGVFSYYLMQGLRGKAADSQGVISADSIYQYVYHQTLQYIDQTNQQLRLINQQKINRGETKNLQQDDLQQIPQRIVQGAGEVILGLKPKNSVSPPHLRLALVIEGIVGGGGGVPVCKVLKHEGDFELKYLALGKQANSLDVRTTIQNCLLSAPELRIDSTALAKTATVLLYLRGRIENSEAGEAWLVLGDSVRLSRSWLRQQLRRSKIAQQIVVLDCPGASSLTEWIEDLQGTSELGQCLLAAAALEQEPERFATALLNTLNAANSLSGLSAAGWITKLQVELPSTEIAFYSWLSGIQGVIEVLPSRISPQGIEKTQGIDLGWCPYMGLKAFEEKDAQFFHGREDLTQKLINALNHRSFLAVVGASGSGKSSLVHAGLIPELRTGRQLAGSEQWWIGSFKPGSNPLLALSQQLVDSGTDKERKYQQQELLEGLLHLGVDGFVCWLRKRTEPMVVLIVDQFEELFTMASAQERQRFLDVVLGAVKYAGERFKLVISLRLDFIKSCLEVPELYDAIEQSNVLVPPGLTQDDYYQAIVLPAKRVGLEVEPGLVEILLQDLNKSAAYLPLLEFVLEQLWSRRSEGYLTLQAYRDLGGIQKALERRAQELYNSLTPEEQKCAKWIFLKLTKLGKGTEDTRQRILKSQLSVPKYPQSLVETTLQKLTSAKLVVMNLESEKNAVGQSRGAAAKEPEPEELVLERMKQEVTIEVVHEILIRHWSTLRWWLDENRARLQQQQEIAQAAEAWKQSGRQGEYLLWGTRLVEAEALYIRYSDELEPIVQQFIEACLAQRARLKRRVIASILAAALLMLGASGYLSRQAWRNSKKADLYSLALVSAGVGDQESALRFLKEALAFDPNDYHIYESIGVIHGALGQRQEALENFNTTLRLNPDYAWGYYHRGLLRNQLNELQGALYDFTQVVRLDHKPAYGYWARGVVRVRLRDQQGALYDFTQALRFDHDYIRAYSDRGRLRTQLKDWKGALYDFTQVLHLNPNDAEAYKNRERVLRELESK